MKKYTYLCDDEKRQTRQERLDELLLFQELLRTCEPLNEQFCGRALEIATGLQPWIDALKHKLKK